MIEAAGFRSDVESLLANFIATDSVRFQEFSRIYREMSMGLVFFLLEDEEVPVFLDCAYSVAREFLQSKFQFQVRVGALYLLYALFMQQPLIGGGGAESRVKVKMTVEQWNDVIDLMREVKEQEHHDTNFIFYQLYSFKAFYMVVHSHNVIMNRDQNKTNAGSSSANFRLKESISLDNYLDQSLFRSIEDAHRKYQDSKNRLLNSTCDKEDEKTFAASGHSSHLFLCNPNFLSEITSHLTKFSEQIENMQLDKSARLLAEDSNLAAEANIASSSNEPNSGLSTQKEVKMKAALSAVALPRHFSSAVHDMTSEPPNLESRLSNESFVAKEEVSRNNPQEEKPIVQTSKKPEKTPQQRAIALSRKTNTLRTRCVLSNPISNEDMFEGAISLETTGELPYTQRPIIEKKTK